MQFPGLQLHWSRNYCMSSTRVWRVDVATLVRCLTEERDQCWYPVCIVLCAQCVQWSTWLHRSVTFCRCTIRLTTTQARLAFHPSLAVLQWHVTQEDCDATKKPYARSLFPLSFRSSDACRKLQEMCVIVDFDIIASQNYRLANSHFQYMNIILRW